MDLSVRAYAINVDLNIASKKKLEIDLMQKLEQKTIIH